jgi:hypothetical protein
VSEVFPRVDPGRMSPGSLSHPLRLCPVSLPWSLQLLHFLCLFLELDPPVRAQCSSLLTCSKLNTLGAGEGAQGQGLGLAG